MNFPDVHLCADKLLQWHRRHSKREQQLILLLVIIAGLSVLFAKIWVPLQQKRIASETSYQEQHALLQWMQAQEPLAKQAASLPEHADTSPPLSVVLSNSAKQFTIAIKRLEISQDGKASLIIEQVSFNKLISWLDKLESEHLASVDSFTISKTATPGIVNATLHLKE